MGLRASYWLMMMVIPVPGIGSGVLEKGSNLAAYVDSLVLQGHMWDYTRTWDPEGIVSTIPAIATTLFGVLTGHWLRSGRTREEKTVWMFVAGFLLLLLGAIMDMWLPINKNIWTSSYAVFMAGWALVCLGTSYWLIDVVGYKRWALPFVIFGTNAIAVYALSGLVERLVTLEWRPGSGTYLTAMTWVYDTVCLPLAGQLNGSLLYAIANVLIMFVVAWVLWKKQWFLKV
jgi:predicted acyltransferase